MRRRFAKISFERTVLTSLAAVTVMVCGALFNAVSNLQLVA